MKGEGKAETQTLTGAWAGSLQHGAEPASVHLPGLSEERRLRWTMAQGNG